MFIDAILVPEDKLNEDKIKPDCRVVIIDVLRVCTTIVNALTSGVERIFPTLTVREAFDKKEELLNSGISPDRIILGGERFGIRVEGFDLGNSPREYIPEAIEDKILVLSSTNGTRAMKKSAGAVAVIIGTFRNARAIADYIEKDDIDTIFYLSGKMGEFSLEDAVGAGMIIDYLVNDADPRLSDSATMCLTLFGQFRNDLLRMFKLSVHGQYLESLGFEEDLVFCAETNVSKIVPIIGEDSYIVNTINQSRLKHEISNLSKI